MPATATTVVLTFDEAPEADSLTDPAVFAVTVTAGDASSTHTPNSVRISDGSADVRLLLLDRDAIRPGETVSVSYTKPTAPDAIPLQDADGNETAAFTEILMEGGGQLPVYRCDETVRCLNPTLGRVNVPADRGFRARVAGCCAISWMRSGPTPHRRRSRSDWSTSPRCRSTGSPTRRRPTGARWSTRRWMPSPST